jgi:hypothetical protein
MGMDSATQEWFTKLIIVLQDMAEELTMLRRLVETELTAKGREIPDA